MLLIKETIDRFGYNPNSLKPMASRKILHKCLNCNKILEKPMSDYTRGSKLCRSCAKIKLHKNPNSGYNSETYRKKRSEIAIKSNKNRKIHSSKYQKYLPFLEKVANGDVTFLEIGKELGIDNSTVCRFFHDNFNIKSKARGSYQEKIVGKYLQEMFKNVTFGKRYSNNNRYRSDYYIPEIGHIEYDGNGFFHQFKKGDDTVNKLYKPIRLSAQAYFGAIDYLNLNLLNKKTGYCSVKSPKEYMVKKIDKKTESSIILEHCHPLGNCAGTDVFGLYHRDKLIGVAKFGNPTNKYDNGMLELRRFFILDGTPKNTESWFLNQCEKQIDKDLVTYIHADEKGSYLKALNWKQIPHSTKTYDVYIVSGTKISKRKLWGWAKKIGLVDKVGTTNAKEVLAELIGAKKVLEPSKIKFTKTRTI